MVGRWLELEVDSGLDVNVLGACEVAVEAVVEAVGVVVEGASVAAVEADGGGTDGHWASRRRSWCLLGGRVFWIL